MRLRISRLERDSSRTFLLARDHAAPRLFLQVGNRLAFSNGVIVRSATAMAIYIAFGGDTELLIALFAVGVFLSRLRRPPVFNAAGQLRLVHEGETDEAGRRRLAVSSPGAVWDD